MLFVFFLSQSQDKFELDSKLVTPELYELLKTGVTDAILFNFSDRSEEVDEDKVIPQHADAYKPVTEMNYRTLKRKVKASDNLLRDILNSVATNLAAMGGCEHLESAQYGNDVAIKAYWKRCGYEEQKPRGAFGIDSDTISYQYDDVATYQIKCDRPLKPVSIGRLV